MAVVVAVVVVVLMVDVAAMSMQQRSSGHGGCGSDEYAAILRSSKEAASLPQLSQP